MRQNFTRFFALMMLCFSINTVKAQTVVWPVSTDTNTVKASQFADSSLVFQKTATKSPAADYKGWVSVGISSDDPAKKDSAQWVWSRSGRSRGAFVGAARQIASPTAANGTVIFDSDFLDTRGISNNFGGGPAPSPHKSELISPTMNATGYTDLIVEFNQLYRAFDSDCSIQYSNDDGATWSKQYFVNAEIAANASTPNPLITTNTDSTKKTVILFGSTGSNKFKIKFVFDGDYYFWILDDVKLINNKFYDMQVSTNFYAIPPTAYTPVNQLDTIRFLADVSNAGTNAMNNVKLQVKVWRDADKALIYNSTSSQYPASFKPDTAYENRILPDVLPPTALSQVGKYFGSYRVLGDSSKADINPKNDTIRFEFWVSDTTAANSVVIIETGSRSNYAKENLNTTTTRLGNGYWTGTEPRSVRYGNYYRINKVPATITTLTARFDKSAAVPGRRVQGSLYEWKDANNDGSIQLSERILVAAADTLISKNQPPFSANAVNGWFIFNLLDISTNKFFYPKANTDYLAVVEFDAPSITSPVDSNYMRFVFNDATFNYGAMRYVTDSVNAPRYSIILGKTADSDWSTGGFTNQFLVPVVRLNVLPFRLSSTPSILSDKNTMLISPNPVGQNSIVNIQVDLENMNDALFRVMNIDGKLMTEQVLDKFKTQNIQLKVHDYPNGTYMVQILTPEGIMTKRFVKAD